jgi:hypothetical protein
MGGGKRLLVGGIRGGVYNPAFDRTLLPPIVDFSARQDFPTI